MITKIPRELLTEVFNCFILKRRTRRSFRCSSRNDKCQCAKCHYLSQHLSIVSIFFSSINDKATQAKNAAIKKKPTIHDKKHLNRFFFLPLALRRFIRKFEEKR